MKKSKIILVVVMVFAIISQSCNKDNSIWVCKPEKGLKITMNIDENGQHATIRVVPKKYVSSTHDYLFHDGQQLHLSNDTLYNIGKHGEWVGTDSNIVNPTDIVIVDGICKDNGFIITSKSENSMHLSFFGALLQYAGIVTEYDFAKN